MSSTDPLVNEIIEKHSQLKAERRQWDTHFQDLAEVFLPRRANFTTEHVDGERLTEEIYDSTPMIARRGLSAAVNGLLKPKSAKWFTVRTADEELNEMDAPRQWLEAVEMKMWRALYNPRALFQKRTAEVDDDLVTFGTGVLFIGAGPANRRLRFQSLHLRHCYVMENEEGHIDTIIIEHLLTGRQAIQRYGQDRAGPSAIEHEKNRTAQTHSSDNKLTYLQIIEPNRDRDPRRADNKNMPFRSVVISLSDKIRVSESGFMEFPLAIPRWDTRSDEVYGRSPCMLALPDALTLQSMQKTVLTAGHKAVDPPMWALSESVIGVVRSYPGGMTYVDGAAAREFNGRPFGPVEMGKNIPLAREMQNDVRDQIQQAFFRNILNLPVSGPEMTATEVVERRQEFLRNVGPLMNQLEDEYPNVILRRVFNIMERAGAFPERPRELRDRQIKFEFRSPVEQARKQQDAASLARSFELLAPFVQAKPQMMDHFDEDEIARDTRDVFGLPQKYFKPLEEVVAEREARNQLLQQQQLIDAGQQVAEIDEVAARAEQQRATAKSQENQ